MIHWQEEPLVSHSTERPPDEDRYVLLARIVLNQNGVVDDDSILLEESDGSSVRRYSGLSGKRLETDILTLTDPEISESHPWMDARLFTVGSQDKRGIDIFSEHTRLNGDMEVTGSASFHGRLEIETHAAISGNLNVSGYGVIEQDLSVNGTSNLQGDLKVSGNLEVTGKNNLLPPGTVIATVYEDLIPPIGEVANGWMRADGRVVPSGHTLSGRSTPNLSDSRFLMGSTSPGATGGANTKTLSVAELPFHKHDVGVTIASTGNHHHNVSGSSKSNGEHNHSLLNGSISGGTHFHTSYFRVNLGDEENTDYDGTWVNKYGYVSATNGKVIAESDNSYNAVYPKIGGGGHTHSLSNIRFSSAESHSHIIEINEDDSGSHFHTATVTESHMGSSASWDSRPRFLSCVYLVKVD